MLQRLFFCLHPTLYKTYSRLWGGRFDPLAAIASSSLPLLLHPVSCISDSGLLNRVFQKSLLLFWCFDLRGDKIIAVFFLFVGDKLVLSCSPFYVDERSSAPFLDGLWRLNNFDDIGWGWHVAVLLKVYFKCAIYFQPGESLQHHLKYFNYTRQRFRRLAVGV